jgi:hypothetical protein
VQSKTTAGEDGTVLVWLGWCVVVVVVLDVCGEVLSASVGETGAVEVVVVGSVPSVVAAVVDLGAMVSATSRSMIAGPSVRRAVAPLVTSTIPDAFVDEIKCWALEDRTTGVQAPLEEQVPAAASPSAVGRMHGSPTWRMLWKHSFCSWMQNAVMHGAVTAQSSSC